MDDPYRGRMVLHERSYLVRFYAVNGEHRVRVSDVQTSRAWTVSDAAAAEALRAQLDRPAVDGDATAEERAHS
jgi:hypothetical protein